MWLINTKTLELHNFLDAENAPKYAILSHCWGEEEMTHKDLRKKRNLAGAGYMKIKRCCEYAREFGGACYDSRTGWEARHGLDWVWIDTVCIDKQSSTELSEAINSMYLWYRSAAICIAYLEDVNAVEAGPDTFALDLLGNSRWFTRGWTLQELIAPTVVYFVDASWECFGRKNATDPIWPVFEQPPSLDREIEAISGIPARILDGTAEASECSIAQRLSWASRRNTSGREDLADCLLGLFNVNMPLIYGEGDEAFRRLQNEIFSRHRDESIFACPFDYTVEGDDACESTIAGLNLPDPYAKIAIVGTPF